MALSVASLAVHFNNLDFDDAFEITFLMPHVIIFNDAALMRLYLLSLLQSPDTLKLFIIVENTNSQVC